MPLAEKVIEYLDNATDIAECSLADFLSVLEDSPLVVQAIQVQQQAEIIRMLEARLAALEKAVLSEK